MSEKLVDVYEYIDENGVNVRWNLPADLMGGEEDYNGVCLFCGHCGRLWGRRYTEVLGRKPRYWVTETTSCFRHGNGSLLYNLYAFDFFVRRGTTVPREFLIHEFLCATNKGDAST